MEVKVDIRGRVNQWNTKSCLGFASNEDKNFHHVVELKCEYKKQLRKELGNLPDFPEKVHCALIALAIRGHMNKISSIQICNDIGKKKLLKYLKDYLGHTSKYNKIPKKVKSVGNKSAIHKLLVRVGKGKHDADSKLTPSNIKEFIIKK